jgi:hypothetical protein
LLLQIIKRIHAFFVAKIIKQIHVFVVANLQTDPCFGCCKFHTNLKSIKRPPAIRKSFLCQKEIQQEKIKSINQSINQSAHLQLHKQFNMETLN